MVRVKMLRGSEVAIIDGYTKTVCHFDLGGRCIKDMIPITRDYMENMQSLPIVSVLASANTVDLVLFMNDKMYRYSVTKDDLTIISELSSKSGIIKILTRKGKQNDVRFNQTLFIFTSATQIFEIMREIGGRLCE